MTLLKGMSAKADMSDAAGTDRTALAIGLFLLALVLFDSMGLIIKRLGDGYGAAELSAYRNFFALIPSSIALWAARGWHRAGRPWRMRQWKLALARGFFVTLAQLCFYTSLGLMAFATASSISYAMALFTTAMAWPLLGERVGAIRWISVIIGFAGVLMIMGVGSEAFQPASLLPLGAAVLYALTSITARMIDREVSTPLLNLYAAFAAVIGSVALVPFFGGFSPLRSWADLGWIMAMGGFGGTAVLLIILAYRMTEQSNLAPFNYFGIPLAFVMGWAFFGEDPWSDLFPGALLIILGGLLIVWRERRLNLSRSASRARALAGGGARDP